MKTDNLFSKGLDIVQNCWVVADIDAAIRGWVSMGYGPFFTFEMDVPDAIYRGQPVPLKSSIALAQAGGVQIELIQQLSTGPSAYRDVYGPGESGFHHVCTISDDFDAEVARLRERGIEIATEYDSCCYADTRKLLGCVLEVLPNSPLLHKLFKMVADAGRDWDGADPVRPINLAALLS